MCRCDEVGIDGGGSGGGIDSSTGGGRDGEGSDGNSGGGSGDRSARESEPQQSATSSALTGSNQGIIDSSRSRALFCQSQQKALQGGEQAGGVVSYTPQPTLHKAACEPFYRRLRLVTCCCTDESYTWYLVSR